MTYNPGIPTSGQLISASQPQILTNFTQLNNQFGVDHSPFYNGSVNGDGTHLQVTLNTPQGSDPSPTGTQGELYTKDVSGVAQLFFANSSGVSQLTDPATANPIKAWGYCTLSGTTFSFAQSSGVASVTYLNTGYYQVTLANGIVSSANFAVTISSEGNVISYSGQNYTATQGSFFVTIARLITGAPINIASFSFTVLQL